LWDVGEGILHDCLSGDYDFGGVNVFAGRIHRSSFLKAYNDLSYAEKGKSKLRRFVNQFRNPNANVKFSVNTYLYHYDDRNDMLKAAKAYDADVLQNPGGYVIALFDVTKICGEEM
jgi:hypothetical protein